MFDRPDGSLRDDGVTILRAFLDPEALARIRSVFDAAFHAVDCGVAAPALMEQVSKVGRINLSQLRDAGIPEAALHDLIGLVENRVTRAIGPCRLLVDHSLMRRVVDIRRRHIWHIDADGAGTSSHDPAFNVWCPLSRSGAISHPSGWFANRTS